MRLPSVNSRGVVVPILPILGMVVLAVGVVASVNLAQGQQDTRSRASANDTLPTITARERREVCTTLQQKAMKFVGFSCPKASIEVDAELERIEEDIDEPLATPRAKLTSPKRNFSDLAN